MTKGKICLVFSAIIYGAAPLLAKIAYQGGVNEITLTFLRTFLALPLLFILMFQRKQSFMLTIKELVSITVLGLVGGTLGITCLYISYNYISTGLATTLHFIYPLIIVIVSALIYKEKITRAKLAAVMLVTIGIFLFVDLTSMADKIGVMLAVLSGVFYSFYVIYIGHSDLKYMDYVKLTFYLMIVMSIGTFVFGTVTNNITFDNINAVGWIFSALISVLISLGAIPLFQAGVRYEGASTAGIISALEPVTTIILGVAILGEPMGFTQYIGGGLIITGIVLAEKNE